jgi:hypothetical protein
MNCNYRRRQTETCLPARMIVSILRIIFHNLMRSCDSHCLEHITRDPMQTLSEINRITKNEAWLMLSTPICTSLRAVVDALRGQHPCMLCEDFEREECR